MKPLNLLALLLFLAGTVSDDQHPEAPIRALALAAEVGGVQLAVEHLDVSIYDALHRVLLRIQIPLREVRIFAHEPSPEILRQGSDTAATQAAESPGHRRDWQAAV